MPRAFSRSVPIVLLGFLLAACQPGAGLPLLDQPALGPYQLGTGDELRVTVFGQTQLSSNYFVGPQGTIAVPLLGNIPASNRTSAELGDEIAADLRNRKLMVDPSVSVDIIAFRPIYVLGEVEKPGAYPYQPGLTMLSAVALAGGFTYRGVTSGAAVVRTHGGVVTPGRVMSDSLLQPGDVLTISERFF